MRIPKVGESGWQVMGEKSLPKGKWFDCEILAYGNIYGLKATESEYTILTPSYPNPKNKYGASVTSAAKLRRKPEQNDSVASEYSFERIITWLKDAEVKG